MSDLINQTLPEAVRKHLQVMEIELPAGRPVLVHAGLREGRWVVFPTRHRLAPGFINALQSLHVTKVELRINGMLSEFDIEDMVW